MFLLDGNVPEVQHDDVDVSSQGHATTRRHDSYLVALCGLRPRMDRREPRLWIVPRQNRLTIFPSAYGPTVADNRALPKTNLRCSSSGIASRIETHHAHLSSCSSNRLAEFFQYCQVANLATALHRWCVHEPIIGIHAEAASLGPNVRRSVRHAPSDIVCPRSSRTQFHALTSRS